MRKIPIVGAALYGFAQWLCGLITKHEHGDWDYGGGDFVNINCKWCNYRYQISQVTADEHLDFSDKLKTYFDTTPEEFTDASSDAR